MKKTNNEVDAYIENLKPVAKDWISYFVNYMREHHPNLEELIYYTRPTYKLGGKNKNYIMFSNANNDFSLHTHDFEYIKVLQSKLSKPGKGKSCARVPYENIFERNIIIDVIEDIIRRQEINNRQ